MANPSLSRPVRNLVIVLSAVGFLFFAVFILFTWFVRRPFPKVRGKVELPGIARSVEILRDDDGVPHIWAENPEDLYFAQGWVHAQDRAWQMEFQRRIAAGRLSEILGDGTINSDRFLRTMGYYEVARQEYEAMAEPYRSWLESYSDGVNAYFESRSPGQLGLEFAILRLTGTKWDIEAWSPVDSLAWGKIITQGLSKNMSDDLRRLNLGRFIGMANLSDWYSPYRTDMPVTVTEAEFSRFRQKLGLPPMPGTGENGMSGGGGEGAGTNVWVLAPERTRDVEAILVSDMHLGVQMPSIWHEIGLHILPEGGGEEHHIRGYMFPGIPGVVSGQNQYIAWAQANLRGDVQDVVAERIHPEDPNLYLVDDEWVPMEVRTEVIRVEGEDEPVVHEVRLTRHGPLITTLENYTGMAGYTWDNGELYHTELALNWPALRPGTQLEAILRLDRARNYEEFREALSYWDAPSINYVYADRDGNIGYQASGSHPDRPAVQGRLPSPGWNAGEGRLIDFDDLPASFNPEKGYAVSSNNALVYPEYPGYIGTEFSNGFRARRISELIEVKPEGMTVEDIRAVFMDTWTLQADETLDYFERIDSRSALEAWEQRRESWKKDKDAGENGEPSRRERRKEEKEFEKTLELIDAARTMLDEWDRHAETDSAGAAVFGFV